jgi:hypothetical protein
MAQTGYTPISLYYSTTASTAPTAGNLANGELAINITDGILFYKDNAGAVQTLATKAATSGTYSSITLSGGTANGVAYLNGSKVVTTGTALTFDGTNLGIGGTGQLRFSTSGGAVGDNWIQTTNSYDLTLYCGRGSTTQYNLSLDYFKWAIGGSEQMRLTSTGLGIGTSSPSYKLDVFGAAASTATIKWQNSGRASGYLYSDGGGVAISNSASNAAESIYLASGYMFFQTGNAEQMRLTSTGLGIGTSSPATRLDLVANSDDTVLRLRQTNAPTVAYYTFSVDHLGSGELGIDGYLSGTTYTGLRLSRKGNLGLGVTPDAWSNFGPAFQIAYAGLKQSYFSSTNSQVTLLNNAYEKQDTTYAYMLATNKASAYKQIEGAHQWLTAGTSGGVGTAVSFTQAMTLDASGNLLVGTTTNSNSTRGVIGWNSGTQFGLTLDDSYTGAASATAVYFRRNGSNVGSITTTTTGTLYNITSDYRLKEVIGAVSGFGERIDALQPIDYEWKSDGSRTRGFLAHKFQEVYPNSVSGEKDAVDANGKPVYQTMQASTSEVIADLVAEIQSLRKRLAAAGI